MDFESAAVHTVTDSEISLPLPFNILAPSSPPTLDGARLFSCTNSPHRYDSDTGLEIADTDAQGISQVSQGKGSVHEGFDQAPAKGGTGRNCDDMKEVGILI